MPDDPKQLPAPPRVTAIVIRNGVWEARIEKSALEIVKVGPQGGRQRDHRLRLDAVEADSLLDLVRVGRENLARMEEQA